MRLASVHEGDPLLTGAEDEVLERLLDTVSELSESDVDAWFARLERMIPRYDAAHLRTFNADCTPVDRIAAVAVVRLSSEERDALDTLIEHHPHTYFNGFHEQAHLRRAFDLAKIGARCGVY